jgi:hypothetical protein
MCRRLLFLLCGLLVGCGALYVVHTVFLVPVLPDAPAAVMEPPAPPSSVADRPIAVDHYQPQGRALPMPGAR